MILLLFTPYGDEDPTPPEVPASGIAGRRPGLVRIPWTRLNPEDDEWDDLVAALLD